MAGTTITSANTGLTDLAGLSVEDSGSILRSLIWTKNEIYKLCESFKQSSMFDKLKSDGSQVLPSCYYTYNSSNNSIKCNLTLDQTSTMINVKYPNDFIVYQLIYRTQISNNNTTVYKTIYADENLPSNTSTYTYSKSPIYIKLSNKNVQSVNYLIDIMFKVLKETRLALVNDDPVRDVYITTIDATKRNDIPYILNYIKSKQRFTAMVDDDFKLVIRLELT